MHHRHAAGVFEVEQIIAIGHRIERVGDGMVEAEQLGRHGAVERIGGSRQRRRAQRIGVGGGMGGGQAREIAREHPEIRKHMVAEQHGLGMLQMRIARHHRAEMLLRLGKKHATQRDVALHERRKQLLRIKAQIERNLVVARPARMQPGARRADIGRQRRLYGHVDVLIVRVECERPVVHAPLDGRKPPVDRRRILGGNYALRRKHAGVGARSGDIVRIHMLIRLKRGAELLRERIDALGESSRPQCHTNLRTAPPHSFWLLKVSCNYLYIFSLNVKDTLLLKHDIGRTVGLVASRRSPPIGQHGFGRRIEHARRAQMLRPPSSRRRARSRCDEAADAARSPTQAASTTAGAGARRRPSSSASAADAAAWAAGPCFADHVETGRPCNSMKPCAAPWSKASSAP